MVSIAKRSDTVIDETCRPAPHHDVTALETHPPHRIGATFATPKEYARQPKRNGDNRSPGILLVAVLMKAEFGAGDIPIDEAGVGIIMRKPGLGSGSCG